MTKQINRTILLSLTAIVLILTACVKGDFETPPIVVPHVNFKANTTISQLLLQHPSNSCDSIGDTIIISGIVTANDQSGNIYKAIVIQDSTAGILISINKTSLYADFRVGQRVFVKCMGMYIGKYSELPQLGYIYGTGIGQLPKTLINDHLFLDGLPSQDNVPEPLVVTPGATMDKTMLNKLVRIENISFVDAGESWATTDATTDRALVDVNATEFVVRTSNYANFAANLIPAGSGTIQGILGYYGNKKTYQLAIRDTKDIIGFKNVKIFFSESFASSLGAFTTQNVLGDQVWSSSAYGATMSGFATSANHANEDWLISPAIDLSDAATGILRFSHTINKGDLASVQSDHTVWISKDYSSGAPSTASWEQLTVPGYPAGTDWNFVSSGDVVIPAAYLGQTNVKIAFKYLSSASQSATWEIKGVKVTE
jgi:hypothetical protein